MARSTPWLASALLLALASTSAAQTLVSGGRGGMRPTPKRRAVAIEYGMNSAVNGWAERSIPFADALARGLEFEILSLGSLSAAPAPLIPHGEGRLGAGWPDSSLLAQGEQAATRLFVAMRGSMPDGRTDPYVLVWEGSGRCRLSGQAVLREANRRPNRVEVFIDPSAGVGNSLLYWVLESSDPTDPLRNAHVWLPGTEEEQPILWRPYVEKLGAMNRGEGPNVWRSLNWNRIRDYGARGRNSFVFDLAGRTSPASPSQGTRRGVCPEFQVALCNAVDADLHLNVPHQADPISDADYEAFLTSTFLAVRDGSRARAGVNGGQPFEGLRPHLKLMLEFSNEAWNPSFPVFDWIRARSIENGVTFERQLALEIERVFDIAARVFSGKDAPRLGLYVGGRVSDASFLARVLAALRPGLRVDSVGTAGYFKPQASTINAWMAGADPETGACPNCPTPMQVLAAGRESIEGLRLFLARNRAVARAYLNPDGSSPEFTLYEAGQSFVAGPQPWGPAAATAQLLPGMFDTYVDHLIPMFIEEGVTYVNWYSFMSDNTLQGGELGPFGLWDNMRQEITLPVPIPYVHEGVPKAAAIYLGPPLLKRARRRP